MLSWSSAGVVGFKGSKKSTPFAAQVAAEDAVQKVVPYGLKDVDVEVCGPGAGRETAIRSLQSAGLNVKSITDKPQFHTMVVVLKNLDVFNLIRSLL